MKLFPKGVATNQSAPRRSFPVQSQGINFYSSSTLAQTTDYLISQCDTYIQASATMLENAGFP